MDHQPVGAAFNSAMEFCRELTMIRRELHNARLSKNWQQTFILLQSYYVALSSRMSDKPGKDNTPSQQEEQDTNYKKVKEHYNKILEAQY